jgi:hypothetical protein
MTIEVGALTLRMLRPRELAADLVGARASLERLLEAVRQRLEPALARAFAWLEDDPRVIFIESLEFQLCVEVDRPPEELAAMVAAQIARRLHAKLADPGVACFRDRAERLARFLLDLSRGAAYTKPWHECFAGLKLLPVSAILRTLIEAQPPVALDALSRLALPDREGIVRALTSGDAARAAAAVIDPGSRACHDPQQVAQSLAQLGRAWDGSDPVHRVLLAAALAKEGLSLDEETLATAEALTRVAARASDPAAAAGATATSADLATPDREARALGLDAPGIAGGAARSRRELESLLQAARQLSQSIPADSAGLIEITRAGAWLLWPHLLERLSAMQQSTPQALESAEPAVSAASLTTALAFAAFALAWGAEAGEVWADHGLRRLLDLPSEDDALLEVLRAAGTQWDLKPSTPRLRGPDLARPLGLRRRDLEELVCAGAALGLPTPLARRLAQLGYRALRGYACRLPGFGASSNAFLRRQFLATRGVLSRDGTGIRVRLAPPPLDVLWRISGAGCAAFSLPDGTPVRVEVER